MFFQPNSPLTLIVPSGLYQSSLSIDRVLEVVKMKCSYNEKDLWPYMMQVIKTLVVVKKRRIFF
jgi:hypothetical protein